MSEIELYEALVEAGASKERARAAVDDLARAQEVVMKTDLKATLAQQEVAAKSDLEAALARQDEVRKADLAQQENRMTWKVVVLAIGAVAVLKLMGIIYFS